jgi:hypothetical protein
MKIIMFQMVQVVLNLNKFFESQKTSRPAEESSAFQEIFGSMELVTTGLLLKMWGICFNFVKYIV